MFTSDLIELYYPRYTTEQIEKALEELRNEKKIFSYN